MISLNPFKKKEDEGFKLDEYSLPSLGDDMSSSNTIPENSELPSLGDSNAFGSSGVDQNSMSFNSNPVSSDLSNSSNQTSFDTSGTPGITSSLPSSFTSTPVESHTQMTPEAEGNASLQQDIAKAKMETIATKIELIEARQHSMEQKLEQIYQMLAMEVSPETKKRLKIKSMMDSIKD